MANDKPKTQRHEDDRWIEPLPGTFDQIVRSAVTVPAEKVEAAINDPQRPQG